MTAGDARLLLVDDDTSSIRAASRMLGHYRQQRFATSGADALRLARETPPDLIVLDAHMPGMSGLDVCDAMQSEPVLARVPVIFASGDASASVEISALDRGAADFVAKPLVAAQLVARARAQLRSRRLVEELKLDHRAACRAAAPTAGGVPRLLIVDDDVVSVRILMRTIADFGEIHFATDASDALCLARELQPDLILLDMHMPDTDGFGLLATLKEKALLQRHAPIVFVTRFSEPRLEMRALDLGAADFVAKPYRPAVLRARLRRLLERKQRTDTELSAIHAQWRRLGDDRVVEIVGSASDAILSYDASGTVVLANAAAGRIFDFAQEGLVGRPMHALLGCAADGLEPLLAGRPKLSIRRRDASPVCVEVSWSQSGSGPDRLATVMLRDVTDREQLEAEARSCAQAHAGSQMKSMMLSYIAHEVGNPLNGVLGFAKLMQSDRAHALPEAQAIRLGHVMTSACQLRDLMRDMMDLGRFERGGLTINVAPTDLPACMDGAIAAIAPKVADAGQRLVTCSPWPALPVMADAQRLHQCLVNLLTNAVKYNRRGGAVTVDVAMAPQQVEITVGDEGIGLDATQQQHLFEPFNRLGRDAGDIPGTGLGLVITRHLVEAMGGSIGVESASGAGSRFKITLPRPGDGSGDQERAGKAE